MVQKDHIVHALKYGLDFIQCFLKINKFYMLYLALETVVVVIIFFNLENRLTNWLIVFMRFAPQSMRNRVHSHGITGTRIQIAQYNPRPVRRPGNHLQRIVPHQLHFIHILSGIYIRLPTNIQPIHKRPRVLYNRSTRSGHDVQEAFVGLDFFGDGLNTDGVIPAWKESIEGDFGFVAGDGVAVAGGAFHFVVGDNVAVLVAVWVWGPGDVDDAVAVVCVRMKV